MCYISRSMGVIKVFIYTVTFKVTQSHRQCHHSITAHAIFYAPFTETVIYFLLFSIDILSYLLKVGISLPAHAYKSPLLVGMIRRWVLETIESQVRSQGDTRGDAPAKSECPASFFYLKLYFSVLVLFFIVILYGAR